MNQFESISDLGISEDNRKRKNEDEDSDGDSKRPRADDVTDDDDARCFICSEIISQEDDECASLKCGHMFCCRCLIDWISHSRTCPKCLAPAKKSDIRIIYHGSRRGQTPESNHQPQMDEAELTNGVTSDDLGSWDGVRQGPLYRVLPVGLNPFTLARRIDRPPTSSRQHFASAEETLAITCPVVEGGATSFGVEMYDWTSFRSQIALHESPIADLSFRADTTRTLLSCTGDGKVRWTDVYQESVIQRYDLASPIMACFWAKNNSDTFYVGQRDGTVKEFDIRMRRCVNPRAMSLDFRLKHVNFWDGEISCQMMSGLLAADSHGVTFTQHVNADETVNHLPWDFEDHLASMHVHHSGHILGSFRTSHRGRDCLHQVAKLKTCRRWNGTRQMFSSEGPKHDTGYHDPKKLSRKCMFSSPDAEDVHLACVANSSQGCIDIMYKSKQIVRVPSPGHVWQIEQLGRQWLGVLTDKAFNFHLWEV